MIPPGRTHFKNPQTQGDHTMTENEEREKAYPIGQYPAVNQDAILLARASAIQAYASLELSLSLRFAEWLGAPIDAAGLVFFRITNTYSRTRILDDLKKRKFQEQYNLFWNSLVALIRTIDQRRNEIVHWHVVNNIDLRRPHEQASRLSLKPPTGWTNPASGSIDENDLNECASRSWCGPAGESPAQVRGSTRLLASVAWLLATAVAKRTQQLHGVWD
jgi:hypothetical protein